VRPLLLAVVFLRIAVLVLRRTDPELVRAYVEPEDGVQPVDPYPWLFVHPVESASTRPWADVLNERGWVIS
jgi:hypothetical protein